MLVNEAETILRRYSRAELYRDIVAQTQASPLFAQAAKANLRRQEAGQPLIIRSALDVLFEQRLRCIELLHPEIEVLEAAQPDDLIAPADEMRIISTALAILSAQPILWEDDVRLTAAQLTLPFPLACQQLEVKPSVQWWTFPTDLADKGLWALLIQSDDDNSITCVMCSKGAEHQRILSGFSLDRSATFADSSCMGVADSFLVKFLTYMNSPYIPQEAHSVSRSEARAAGYKNAAQLPSVRFMSLRKTLRHNNVQESGETEEKRRQYRHQWFVSGHIRNQWFPGEKVHKLIYVPPYVKGPSTAPFLLKVGHMVR